MGKVSSEYNLAVIHPEIAKLWHPTLNGSLTARSVTPSSSKKVSWQCRKGHIRQDTVSSRVHFQTGCPYCSGRRVCADNCLKAVAPDIARQWHPTRNIGLTPKDVTPGSNRKVWWVCEKGHVWQAKVRARRNGTGCPGCSGHQPTETGDSSQRMSPRSPTKECGGDVARGTNGRHG
jgi:hypothetical protein